MEVIQQVVRGEGMDHNVEEEVIHNNQDNPPATILTDDNFFSTFINPSNKIMSNIDLYL